MNITVLTGRLCADPEYRTTSAGTACAKFRLAVNRNYSKPGEEKKADFINCQVWRVTADYVSKYIKKGQLVEVWGELQSDTYEDKQGQKHTVYFVNVDHINALERRQSPQTAMVEAETAIEVDTDDLDAGLPF